MLPIQIIPLQATNTLTHLREVVGTKPILVADFYIEGAKSWEETSCGLLSPDGSVLNVDHHADLPSMRRAVSSANLALECVRSRPPGRFEAVIINHLDCDSVLSAGILSGRLEPEDRYGEAALAADHTGKENAIADLLQGLDAHWSRNGRPLDPHALEYFLESLRRLEDGHLLETFAREAFSHRQRSRERAAELVESGRFEIRQGVALAVIDEPVEGELFLPLLAESSVIAMMNPLPADRTRFQVKVRLNLRAPAGLSLQRLRIHEFDGSFGGRWNAGSNRRGGGTDLSPERYLDELTERLASAIEELEGS